MSLSSLAENIVDIHLAGGVVLNSLLIYAIRRFSSSSIATYKYLLAVFASFDIFLSMMHAITKPEVGIVDKMWGIVTDTALGDRRVSAVYVACYTVPFALMIINFLFRFWAIRHPHRIVLFTKSYFIALLSMAPIGEFIVWYLIISVIGAGEEAESSVSRLRAEYKIRFGKLIMDGWCFVNFSCLNAYADHSCMNGKYSILSGESVGESSVKYKECEEEDGLRDRSVTVMILFDIIMVGSFSVATTLAVRAYRHIVKAKRMNALSANATSSHATINFQYKLLLALCAQTFVPLVFVYIPYMGVNHFAFFDMPSFSVDRLCMPLTACFPAWDAVIIIAVIRDYRQGLLVRLRRTKIGPATTTWKGVSTSAVPSSITPVS